LAKPGATAAGADCSGPREVPQEHVILDWSLNLRHANTAYPDAAAALRPVTHFRRIAKKAPGGRLITNALADNASNPALWTPEDEDINLGEEAIK
jgi:hypothetical protein